ncbi:hypothetical protein ACP4OV_007222 [Aristida adscensionis]
MASTKMLLALLPPVSVLLVVAVRWLCRAAARGLTALARAQFACPPAAAAGATPFRYLSSTARASKRAMRQLPVAPYRPPRQRCGGGGEEAAVECVVCLSGVEEGEEVRELRCRHVFHRSCLDRWLLARPLATCPLCRCRLLTPATTPWEQEEEDYYDDGDDVAAAEEDSDSDSDMMLFMACVHGRGSWFWRS